MNVNPANRTTPTLGRPKSFFDELFGNIGQVGAGRRPRAAAVRAVLGGRRFLAAALCPKRDP